MLISVLGMGAIALAKKLIPKAFEDAIKNYTNVSDD